LLISALKAKSNAILQALNKHSQPTSRLKRSLDVFGLFDKKDSPYYELRSYISRQLLRRLNSPAGNAYNEYEDSLQDYLSIKCEEEFFKKDPYYAALTADLRFSIDCIECARKNMEKENPSNLSDSCQKN